MKAKSRTIRQDVRPYDQRSDAGRGRPKTRSPKMKDLPDAVTDAGAADKSDRIRRGILDATLACFAEYGWSGTNMSVIARRSRMTRGRIQYYFPTLDDLLRAGVDHLMVEWRRKYFGLVVQASDASARFDNGVDVLWGLMRDPLHVAKQVLEATARTNPELRALMQQSAVEDEEATLSAITVAFPELAAKGEAAVLLARDFTVVFMEGLSVYRFGRDAETRRDELIEMLKTVLVTYWRSHGVENLDQISRAKGRAAQTPAPAPQRDENRERVLALLHEAANLLIDQDG